LSSLKAPRSWQAALALSLLALVGCGRDSEGVSVSGKVVYQNQPVAGGALTFFGATGRPVTAPLDQEGAYEVELAPGDYQVTVTIGATLPPGWKEGDPVPPPTMKLPDQYSSRLKTPLTASVKAESDQPIDFNLP
jgi:hypothetical protein